MPGPEPVQRPVGESSNQTQPGGGAPAGKPKDSQRPKRRPGPVAVEEDRLAPGGSEDQKRMPVGCGPEVALTLAEIAAARTRIPIVVDALQVEGAQMIQDVAQCWRTSVAEIIAWSNAEHRALVDFFAEYAQSLKGGDLSGDALGLVSVANLFNPLSAAARAAVSIVAAGAGYMARQYNRKLEEWRQGEVAQELIKTGGRMNAIDGAQHVALDAMITGLFSGTLAVESVAFQAGGLTAVSPALEYQQDALNGGCRTEAAGGVDAVLGIARRTLQQLSGVEPKAWQNVNTMRRLPQEIEAELRRSFEQMKLDYLQFLTSQGPIKVSGTMTYDGQSGGDFCRVKLESVSAVGRIEASGLGPDTERVLLEQPGRVIAQTGGTYELTLESTIHTYAQPETRSSHDEHGPPETLSDTMVFRVGRDGAKTDHAYGNRFPLARLAEQVNSRQ